MSAKGRRVKKFEENLMLMIKNIDFRNLYNKFWEKLKHDITKITDSIKVIVTADKTRKLQWKKKIIKNIFLRILQKHKKSNRNKKNKVNLDGKKIADKLSISGISVAEK